MCGCERKIEKRTVTLGEGHYPKGVCPMKPSKTCWTEPLYLRLKRLG